MSRRVERVLEGLIRPLPVARRVDVGKGSLSALGGKGGVRAGRAPCRHHDACTSRRPVRTHMGPHRRTCREYCRVVQRGTCRVRAPATRLTGTDRYGSASIGLAVLVPIQLLSNERYRSCLSPRVWFLLPIMSI